MAVLSVIVPVYNEVSTIREILEKINSLNLDKEVIVVDDSSTDGTDKILSSLRYDNFKVIHHSSRRGKGAAVLTGLSHASGEYVIFQDADLEYDPNDYTKLIGALNDSRAGMVLGARFTKGYDGMFLPKLGNRFLTAMVNLLFGVKLNDCFTCYKLMRRTDLVDLCLKSESFDIEIEIIAKSIRKKIRIVEVPVSYRPRKYSQGKKIRMKDGIFAVMKIIKLRLS